MIASMFNFATASIYHWLNTGQLNFDLSNLPNRNIYQKRSKEKRGTFVTGKSIEKCPINVNNRPLKINQLQTDIEKFRACSD